MNPDTDQTCKTCANPAQGERIKIWPLSDFEQREQQDARQCRLVFLGCLAVAVVVAAAVVWVIWSVAGRAR